jgi:hypothetical protein
VLDDVELYLQCTAGTATVDYGPAGRSTCPPGGQPLIARITAASYPASVRFTVVAEGDASWVLAVDSHPVTIEGVDGTAVLSTRMRAACAHVGRAVTAQEENDWTKVTAELNAAWVHGHVAGDREFAESVPSPGSIEPGDRQTLVEQTDTLARRCGIPAAE